MPRPVVTDGSQTCTPGTDHALHTWDAPAGGASYTLVVDASALADGEVLSISVEREVRSGGARVLLARYPVAAHAGSGAVESAYFGAPEGLELRVGIRQDGGTGRAIPWSLERVA